MEKKTNEKNFFDIPMIPDTQYMKADIYEDKTRYNIDIDLPGFKKENIKVIYENGYLTVNAIKEELNKIVFETNLDEKYLKNLNTDKDDFADIDIKLPDIDTLRLERNKKNINNDDIWNF